MENFPKNIRIAILDLYNGEANQGMRGIKEIVKEINEPDMTWRVFDVRAKHELPTIADYDIFISSGGPGNPHIGDGIWETQWYRLIDQIWQHNRKTRYRRKHVFFICHSFQMACIHFGLATVSKRKSTSFGVLPVHKTYAGMQDPLLCQLPEPYFCVDSRDYQAVQPDDDVLDRMNATILSLEKMRPHVALERAVMAIRFSDEMVGTQFHPEADPEGMLMYLRQTEKKQHVIETFGLSKYESMVEQLHDPEKIKLTRNTLLPGFLRQSIEQLRQADELLCETSAIR